MNAGLNADILSAANSSEAELRPKRYTCFCMFVCTKNCLTKKQACGLAGTEGRLIP